MTLFKRFEDICLDGVPAEHIFNRLNSAAGNEIETGKIFSNRSSSALCINAFGWFIDKPELLAPIAGLSDIDWPAISIDVECELRFPWRGGKSPWLDAVIETNQYLIGVESKRYEPYTKSTPAKMSEAYWRDVWGDNMEGYKAERDKFKDIPKHYKHLNSRQLVAHSLGIKTQALKKGKKPVLLYIYTDKVVSSPVKVTPEQVRLHAKEISEFSDSVDKNEVKFLALSYAEWINSFAKELSAHEQNLNRSFDLI